jgi:hypothetical protein
LGRDSGPSWGFPLLLRRIHPLLRFLFLTGTPLTPRVFFFILA